MPISKLILLQKAATILCQDSVFCNRWMPITSIQKALSTRYAFNNNCRLLKAQLSKAIGKLDPMIDSLIEPHESGFFRQRFGSEMLLFVQDPDNNPPSFFSTCIGNPDRIKEIKQSILRKDKDMLQNYCNRVLRKRNIGRKNFDEDEIDKIFESFLVETKSVEQGLQSTFPI